MKSFSNDPKWPRFLPYLCLTWNVYQLYSSSKTTEASNNLVLYVRLPGEEDCYYPLFLKEKSVMALKLELAIKMNIDPNTIEKILNKRKTTFSGKSNQPKPNPILPTAGVAWIRTLVDIFLGMTHTDFWKIHPWKFLLKSVCIISFVPNQFMAQILEYSSNIQFLRMSQNNFWKTHPRPRI